MEGSEEWRVCKYAKRRIDQIGSLIGEEEAARGITAAESKFKNSVTEEHCESSSKVRKKKGIG